MGKEIGNQISWKSRNKTPWRGKINPCLPISEGFSVLTWRANLHDGLVY